MSPVKKVPLICEIVGAAYDFPVMPRPDLYIGHPHLEPCSIAVYIIRHNTDLTFDWINRYFFSKKTRYMYLKLVENLRTDTALLRMVQNLEQQFLDKLKTSK